MRKTSTVMLAAITALTSSAASSPQLPWSFTPPTKVEKTLKPDTKRNAHRLAQLKEEFPLLFQYKSVDEDMRNPFAQGQIPLVAPRKGAANPLLAANGANGPEIIMNCYSQTFAGIYGFTPANEITPTLYADYYKTYFNGGCGIYDGKLGGIHVDRSFAAYGIILVMFHEFDMETWQMTVGDTQLSDLSLVATDTAIDPETGEIFGQFYSADGNSREFGVIDYTTLTRTTIGPSTYSYVAIGIGKDGYAYGVNLDGQLCKIDRASGEETIIGNTGLNLKDNYGATYYQTGEIDPKSGVFYWAAMDGYKNSALYTIDLTTGVASFCGKYSDEATGGARYNTVGMMIPAPAAADAAPAAAEITAVEFDGPATSGTIRFTAPTLTFDGSTQLTGDLQFEVKADDFLIASGTVAPGAEQAVEVTLEEGYHAIVVTTSNDEGQGAPVKTNVYVGYDTPQTPSNLTFSVNGNDVSLSWEAPAAGVHNGYIADLTYDVYRINGKQQTLVASDISATEFAETLPADIVLGNYFYGVVAKSHDLASSMAWSDSQRLGNAFQLPYFDSFDANIDLYTVIDANGDNHLWKWRKGRVVYSYSEKNDADDWLITPAIHFKQGSTVELSLKARAEMSQYPEKIEVFFGKTPNPEDMTVEVIPTTELDNTKFITISGSFEPDEEGDFFIGIHAASDAYRYDLSIDDLLIEQLPDPTAPAMVNDLQGSCDPSGALKTTLSFTAPTETLEADELKSISKIEIRRENQMIHTIENATPGDAYSYTDENAIQGLNLYTVIAYNEDGAGEKATINVWAGFDSPTVPVPSVIDNTSSVTLTWESVAAAHGGVLDPASVTYEVYNMDGSSIADYIGSVTGETTYTLDINTAADEEQAFKFWAMRALNDYGASQYGATAVITGKPYTLPFHNSFADGTTENQFIGSNTTSGIMSWTVEEESVDGDNGSAAFTSSTAASGYLHTGKICMTGAANPKLLFSYMAGREQMPAKFFVTVQHKDGSVSEPLWSIDLNEVNDTEWHPVAISLPAEVTSEDYAIVRFNAEAADNLNFDMLFFDNINIVDLEECDASLELSAPESVKKGQTVNLDYTVTNNGAADISGAVVNVTVNGQTIASKTIETTLHTLESANGTISFPTSSLFEGNAYEVKADLLADGDIVADNNTATATIEAAQADVEAPSALVICDETPLTLQWNAPAFETITETEDFEGYEAWSSELGDWTTIDLDKGYAGQLISGVKYPHQGEQFAFINWQPGDYFDASTPFLPYSGQRALAAAYQTNESGMSYVDHNNWLISPRLSGNQQTVTFWVNNFVGNGYGTETFRVLASTTGNAIDNFVQLGDVYTQDSGQWTMITVELEEGTTYFAIHLNTTGSSACLFTIDDITYEWSTAPVAYNIYRNDELVATVNECTWTDADAELNVSYTYKVTAVRFDGAESLPVEASGSVGIEQLRGEGEGYTVTRTDGVVIMRNAETLEGLEPGIYIINGKRVKF